MMNIIINKVLIIALLNTIFYDNRIMWNGSSMSTISLYKPYYYILFFFNIIYLPKIR